MKLALHTSPNPKAQKAKEELSKLYEFHDVKNADFMVVLGGDGSMLHALHENIDNELPLYGMNLGTLGFLLNDYKTGDLEKRIEAANSFKIHPLRMEATTVEGDNFSELAFNEVSLLRQSHSSAKIRVLVNDKERLSELVCDGILVSTPVGSTAYNSSAGGAIIPLDANVLPITPISAFRPRRWPGALINNKCEVKFEILKADERPVNAAADSKEVRNIQQVVIRESRTISKTIMFDPDNPLEERIFQEQFAPAC